MRRGRIRIVSRLAVVLAFLLASLAGGPGRAALPVDPALAAFYAMGGTAGALCGGDLHAAGGAHCDACRPIGAAPLPEPHPGARPVAVAGVVAPWPRTPVAARSTRVAGPGWARAPPGG